MTTALPPLKSIVPILSSPPSAAGATDRLVIDLAEKNEIAAVVPEAVVPAAKDAGREIGREGCLAWMMMTSISHLQIFVLGRRPYPTRAKIEREIEREIEWEIEREIRLAWVMMTSIPQGRIFVLERRPCLTHAEEGRFLRRFPLFLRRRPSGGRW